MSAWDSVNLSRNERVSEVQPMSIADEQRRYYRELLEKHGRDPKALGHRDRATQFERFDRLARLFRGDNTSFSLHEVGPGFGDLGEYLEERFPQALYSGSEVCEEFLEICRRRFPEGSFYLRDVAEQTPAERYDYVTQSGTLNGRLGIPQDSWQRYVFSMLSAMYAMARKGIAANFLTTYGDAELMRPELHYQDEKLLMDFVARNLSRHFELDMAGPLYEFTLRVYRPEEIEKGYPGEEFRRYFGRNRE
jgi:hypothetical protein